MLLSNRTTRMEGMVGGKIHRLCALLTLWERIWGAGDKHNTDPSQQPAECHRA